MASLVDQSASAVEVVFSVVGAHVFGAKPTRIAIKLVALHGMSRHQVDVMSLIDEPQCDLRARDPRADNQHTLGGRSWPPLKEWIKNMVNLRMIAGRPLGPK